MEGNSQNRRSSDRFLESVEDQLRQFHDRLSAIAHRMDILERDGSRGLAVLAERVLGNEKQTSMLVTAADKTHEGMERDISDNAKKIDRLEQIVVQTNLDKIPERVGKLEDARQRSVGFSTSMRTSISVYLAVAAAVAGTIYQLSGH